MNFDRKRKEKDRDFNKDLNKDFNKDLTVTELLSAISETEYPEYILEALSKVQTWLADEMNAPAEQGMDLVTAMFEDSGELEVDKLFLDLESLEPYVDILPNTKRPEGRPDVIVVSLNPPDYDSGIRMAIDYAALFNRQKSQRVWVVSDTFILADNVHYTAHVDALAEQGIALRFILVTPWGWVEIPLSSAIASSHQLLWHNTMRGNG